MNIFIDADGCPVVDKSIKAAKQYGIDCVILCVMLHVLERDGSATVTVSKDADSVDRSR